MIIRPADEQTAKLIEKVDTEGLTISKAEKWRPRILVYDVDKDMSKDDLPKAIASQNPELGVDEDKADGCIKPLFMQCPKNRQTVWWVIETTGSIH